MTNTFERLQKINNDCEAEIKESEKIYLQVLRDAEARKHQAWLRYTKLKVKAIEKRDKLIAEFQKEIDEGVVSK